ncbi:MAG: histidine kinase dimerization/phospho-acceptor domain-containing protein [bacterium]
MSETTKTALEHDLTLEEELELYKSLKPYISHCLTMNHELNNPLAVILGYAEFLFEECGQLSDDQKQYLLNIIKSAKKMQKCVTDLSEEKIALNEKIDLKEVIAFYKKDLMNPE